MPDTHYDEHGLTPNQKLLLEFIEPGVWFDPDDYVKLRYCHSRNQACSTLFDKNILTRRPYSALGFMAWQYMLPPKKAKELAIQHRETE